MIQSGHTPAGSTFVDAPNQLAAQAVAEAEQRAAAQCVSWAENERPRDFLLSIVVPVYNEELVLRQCVLRLTAVLDKLACRYEIIFVDDGSRDTSVAILRDERLKNPNIRIVCFARNFGHQIAITAGMDHARGHAVVTLDADLQDPPELIPDLVSKWLEGGDVVYAKRRTRAGETAFKKWTASIYYRLLRKITSVDVPIDAGDFRLMSKAAVEALSRVRERHRYLRGLVTWLGFKQGFVEYDRDKRFAGTSNYGLIQSIRLSVDGITSFSVLPLRLATGFGIVSIGTACLFALYVLYLAVVLKLGDLGWAAVMVAVLFIGGAQLLCIGIAGEYIGVLHEETKRRPLYVVRDVIE